jgi:predicted metal-dependent peptidase
MSEENKKPKIRPLTHEEQTLYAVGIMKAESMVGSYRDALALMRPFLDESAKTCYVDPSSRVGLSHWFFNDLNHEQRASALLHEASHVLTNCFIRGQMLGADGALTNIASDLEINCGLDLVPQVDLSMGIFPDKEPYSYDRYLTLEQYAHLILQDPNIKKKNGPGGSSLDGDDSDASSGEDSDNGEGQPGQSSGSAGKGSSKDGSKPSHGQGCDEPTEERALAADDAGIARASDAEISIAKRNTAVRMQEELDEARMAGSGAMDKFLSLALKNMQPPKVNWRSILQKLLQNKRDAIIRGRSDYSYRKVSRRLSSSPYIFPGMIKYKPKMMFAIDTSGSMTEEDHLKCVSEVEGIIRAVSPGNDSLTIFSVDTQIANIQPVSRVSEIDLRGGGGTRMDVAWAYVLTLKKEKLPDIFILSTDGAVPWPPVEEELLKSNKLFVSVILVTTASGYKTVPDSLKRLATVIDISEGIK